MSCIFSIVAGKRDSNILLSHSDVHSILGDTPMVTHIAGHEGLAVLSKVKLRSTAS